MPTQDELLLKFIQQGEGDVTGAASDIANSLDKVSDAEKNVSKASKESEENDKTRIRGLADLKAGLDLVSSAGGKVLDFMKESVDETVKFAAEVRDLSRAIGANAEETSQLIQVADDVNVSVGTLEAGFKAAIKNGIQPNIDNLAKLADKYNAIQDPVQRSQFAMDTFGRAGLEMAKILEQGGQAIRDAAQGAKDFGLTLDDNAVKTAREFEIQMDNLGDSADALKLKLGKGALPVVVTFLDTLNKGIGVLDQVTNFSGTLSEAFTGNATKLQEELAGGEITTQQYNAAIEGMAQSVSRWDSVLAASLQNQYLMNDAQAQSMQAFYNTTGAINMQALAQQNAQRIAETAAQADAIRAQGMTDQRDAILAEDAAMAEYNRKLEQKAAADKAAAEAEATHRTSIANTIAALDAQAMSLAKVNDAQAKQMLAQANLDTIKKAYEEGKITQEQYNAATEKVLLNYDLATPKSLAMAKAQEAVTAEFLNGKMPIDEFVNSAGKIPKVAADGKLSLEELTSIGIKSYEGIHKYQSQAMDETTEAIQQSTQRVTDSIGKNSRQMGLYLDTAKLKVQDVDNLIKGMPDVKTVKLIVDVEVKGDQVPGGLPQRAFGGPVSAGMPYVVGERGPEMFVPQSAGYVVPNQTNYYGDTNYNITTDKTGLAFMFARQAQAEARM